MKFSARYLRNSEVKDAQIKKLILGVYLTASFTRCGFYFKGE